MKLGKKEYFAKGKRGIVYTALLGRRKVLVKEFNPASAVNTIAHEAEILQMVNRKGIGPMFIALENGALVREFIEGKEVVKWMRSARKPAIKKVVQNILEQCKALDQLGINKMEMTRPHKHILLQKNKPVFIDFDRSRKAEKTKNVTQVCQFFTSAELQTLLAEKDILLSRENMQTLAKEYKQCRDKKAFQAIVKLVQDA